MKFNVQRVAGTPLTDQQRQELRALAAMPDDQIDFKDIPEQFYESADEPALPLEDHTVTLRVDAEVAEWLKTAAREDAGRINLLLKRAAHRNRQSAVYDSEPLEKAS